MENSVFLLVSTFFFSQLSFAQEAEEPKRILFTNVNVFDGVIEGLANMQLSDEVRTAVTDLHEKGMAQHEAGDHRASEKILAAAMRMLLTNSN